MTTTGKQTLETVEEQASIDLMGMTLEEMREKTREFAAYNKLRAEESQAKEEIKEDIKEEIKEEAKSESWHPQAREPSQPRSSDEWSVNLQDIFDSD